MCLGCLVCVYLTFVRMCIFTCVWVFTFVFMNVQVCYTSSVLMCVQVYV